MSPARSIVMTQQLTQTQTFNRETAEAIARETGEPEWARERRLESWRVYEDTPMPSRNDEDWRRTDVSGLKLDAFRPHPSGEGAAPLQATDLGGTPRMVCAEAQAKGIIFTSLDEALREHPQLVEPYLLKQGVLPTYNKFAALNGAFWQRGTFLYVPRGVSFEMPFVSPRTVGPGAAAVPRTLIVVEPGATATYLEWQESEDAGEAPALQGALHCGVTDIVLKEDAELRYLVGQEWGRGVWDFSITRALLGANSRFRSFTAGLGAKSSRVHLEAILEGNAADAVLKGIYCGDSRQHFEYRTLQYHSAPHTRSDLLYKGALKDRAGAAYIGTVRVGPGGTQSSSNQANHNLLLNSGAKADSIPVLEILAKDIDRCSHGATVGQVDENMLFYLMCRGLSRAEAYELIVAGFFQTIISSFPIPELQERIWNSLGRKLALHYVEPSDDVV